LKNIEWDFYFLGNIQLIISFQKIPIIIVINKISTPKEKSIIKITDTVMVV